MSNLFFRLGACSLKLAPPLQFRIILRIILNCILLTPSSRVYSGRPSHQRLPRSGRSGTRSSTGPALPSGSFACRLEDRTSDPSGTRLLCLKLRGACCHPVDILVLIFFSYFFLSKFILYHPSSPVKLAAWCLKLAGPSSSCPGLPPT